MENKIATTVSTINTIYSVVKTVQFVGEEVDILRDVKEIDNQLKYFNYAKADKSYNGLMEKYWRKLDEIGYFKFKMNTNRTPAEKLKHNLGVLGEWLVRIVAMNACDEVAQSAIKGQLKSIVKKYAGEEVAEITEATGNLLSELDLNLLDKLKVSKILT